MTANPPTEQQLDEITARINAATPGPWTVSEDYTDIVGPDGSQLASYWDPTSETRNGWFIAHARTDVRVLLAELRRARDRVTELEAYAYGCDAEGCAIPHSSWCDAAKKTAAANDGCTCGKPWTGHPQPHAMHCWTVNPPRAEVEEMRKRIAELTAEVSTGNTAPTPTPAPLTASHSPAGDRDGETGAEGAAGRVGDSVHPIADADNPTHLRWGLDDVLWGDDDSVIVLLSGPDLAPYWLELDPERAAVLRSNLAGPEGEEQPADTADPAPAEDFTGTQPCGHDDYHSPHEWADRPNMWCPGIGHDDDQAAAEETAR